MMFSTENIANFSPDSLAQGEKQEPGLFAGLDIGGTKTAVLVVDRALNALGRGVAATVVTSPEDLVEGIFNAVVQTLTTCGRSTADLLAIGAGVPGMVDPQTGMVRLAVNLNLGEFALGPALAERLRVPVGLENDVRAASLGAYRWLNEQTPARYMAYLSIGTGISAGLVVDGRIYHGTQGMAGEIGHVIFDPQGPLCRCGQRGCFEAISAGPAIARQYKEGDGTAESVFLAAEKGDPVARKAIDLAADGVARAIQLLIMAYDVDKVVLGGGVLNAGPAFLNPIQERLALMRRHSSLAERMLTPGKVIAVAPEADVARWGAVLLALEASENPPLRI